MNHKILCGDGVELLEPADLVFFSPPYEDARTYDLEPLPKGTAWVDWMAGVVQSCLEWTDGLVGCVCEGRTRKFEYSATPVLLMAELVRRGVTLRKPPIYKRNGIPGSGGPDWLRNDYEFVVCATNGGRLPWSDNTACGHPPKYGPGGSPSHRLQNGERAGCRSTSRRPDGKLRRYEPPKISNPGNVIDCGAVGGGNMGSPLASENEAPFPLRLAEFFVKSFCPPGGTVLDPFAGSGTTMEAAARNGRNSVSIDIRESQCDLMRRRLATFP